jgi:hypothetical protein
MVITMFQSAQVLSANKVFLRFTVLVLYLVDKRIHALIVNTMTSGITASIFRKDDEGYVAVFRPFPGVLGHGSCPDAASSDLLQQFFWGMEDITPSPDE